MTLLRSPWRVLVIVGLLIAGIWAGLTLRLETELLPLMPKQLPGVQGLEEFQKRFGSEREVFVVADPAMTEPERDKAFRTLRPALEALPGISSVAAPGEEFGKHFPELAAWALSNLPPDRFAAAMSAMSPETAKEKLSAIPEALAGAPDVEDLFRLQFDPLGIMAALSAGDAEKSAGDSGMTSGLAPLMTGEAPPFLIIRTEALLVNFEECIAIADAINGTIAKTLPGERRLLLTGRPAFTAEISRQMRSDMMVMMGVAAVLVCAMFWAFYRTLRPLGWILFFQFLALLSGIIIARVWFGSLNVISMGFASILLGVSMDYSILVYHHFASSQRDDLEMWGRLRRGIWFSAVTTAAAFLILTFSSFPGLRQLAALVAAGLLTSALFATWLLQVVLSAKPPQAPPILDKAAHGMANIIAGRRNWVLGAAALVALTAGYLVWRYPGEFYTAGMNQFQPTSSDAYTGQKWLMNSNASEKDAIYLVRGQSWEEVKATTEALAQKVSSGKMSTWTHLLPAPAHQVANLAQWPKGTTERLKQAFESAGMEEEWSAPTLRLATALERAASGDAPAFGAAHPLLANVANEENGVRTAVVRLPDSAENPVPEGGLELGPAKILPVSWVTLSSDLTNQARHDMARLGGWMLAALVVLCALAHRSLRLVLLNFAALGLALLMLALMLKGTGTTLSPLSLLSVPLLIGLVIDYSLHILMALEHNQGDIHETYAHLGAPVLLTGLSSCIGFGAPILTQQPALRNFGLVMDFGIMSAVLTCLLLLPVLYCGTRYLNRNRVSIPSPDPAPNESPS